MSTETYPASAWKEAPAPEELLRAIVDSSDDAIVSNDLNGVVTSWNKSAGTIFGYSSEEMMGRSVTILVPPERIGEEEEILRKVRIGERVQHFETTRRRKDGKLIDVDVSVSPVRSVGGKIVGASKVTRDISENKHHVRTALLLSAIVNSSDDAIISKNLSGVVQTWNAGAERIFGYAAEEIVGQSVTKLIPPDRQSEEPKILDRLRRGERVDHFETIRVRKGGEHFPVSLTISPVKNAQGEIIGASKIARDITDLRSIAAEREVLLERERSARAEAERANRMKDEFLATISHELRTPLNAIVGWTDVLSEGGADRDEVMFGVDVIRKNAMMQAQLIEDILDLGRIASGKMEMKAELLDVAIILREAIESLQHAADAKRISVRTRVSGSKLGLRGDAKRLRQVLWNLLANAIKFTGQDGSIVAEAIQLESGIEISVTDNGIGIAPVFLPQLFERFRQADASTTRKHGGLGIGLSLVRQLVEMHGGTVRAESAGLGRGAKFIVSLPAAAMLQSAPGFQQDKTASSNSPMIDLTGIKVLALDDDADSVDVMKRILGGRRAEVRTARSMPEALDQLRTFSPDVIISDIGMPGQDGYKFVQHLRKDSFFSSVPAVALTAFARIEDRARALSEGFQTHVAKPVSAAELVAVVRSMANLHSSRGPGGSAFRR